MSDGRAPCVSWDAWENPVDLHAVGQCRCPECALAVDTMRRALLALLGRYPKQIRTAVMMRGDGAAWTDVGRAVGLDWQRAQTLVRDTVRQLAFRVGLPLAQRRRATRRRPTQRRRAIYVVAVVRSPPRWNARAVSWIRI
jgi:hypothetical protein